MIRPIGGRLLFVISAATSYRLQRCMFERASTAQREVTLLYTGGRDSLFAEITSTATNLGVEAISLDETVEAAAAQPLWRDKLPPRRFRSLAAASILLLKRSAQALGQRHAYARRTVAVRRLLRRLRIDAVLCCEDGISSDLAVIGAAISQGIPVVDVPYGNGTRHELEMDLDQKAKDGRLLLATGQDLRILKKIAPQWLKVGKHANAIMHEPGLILAWESLGMTLRDAWIIHGGMSDLLCAENPVALRQYRGEGVPEAKLRLTGSPYCDVMVDALRNAPDAAAAFRQPRRIEPATTRILVSWPPSYHDTYPGRNEFESFAEMTRAAFSFLKSLPNTRLTISLHPACDGNVRRIVEELDLSIAEDYLLELIPQNDIFTTYFSSTIRWALAAGKVVVNYDAYKAGLATYDDAPGFVNASGFETYCQVIQDLAGSEAMFTDLAARQIAVADEWGVIDGQCTQRILEEVDRLIGSWRPRHWAR